MKELFDEIKNDHAEVKDILGKLRESSINAQKTREKLFARLKDSLVPHLKAEEATLYRELMETRNGRQLTLEAREEHGLTETVFDRLEKTPVGEELWGARLKVLKDLVEHHIGEEEEEIFPVVEKELDKDTLSRILQDFRKEKEKVRSTLS